MGHHKDADKPRKFRDSVEKGKLDSAPIRVPTDFGPETGSSLNLPVTKDNSHPEPFAIASFHPSSQKFS